MLRAPLHRIDVAVARTRSVPYQVQLEGESNGSWYASGSCIMHITGNSRSHSAMRHEWCTSEHQPLEPIGVTSDKLPP